MHLLVRWPTRNQSWRCRWWMGCLWRNAFNSLQPIFSIARFTSKVQSLDFNILKYWQIFKNQFFQKYVYMCRHMCMDLCMWVQVCVQSPKECIRSSGAGNTEVLNHLTQVLGIELWFSTRAAHTLDHWATSLDKYCYEKGMNPKQNTA